MTDQTGLIEFTKVCIAQDQAEAAELPERWRELFERTLRLLESQLEEHGPDAHLSLNSEALCYGCVEDVVWPCDFALRAAAIWREEPGYRPEWGDALGAHPIGQGH